MALRQGDERLDVEGLGEDTGKLELAGRLLCPQGRGKEVDRRVGAGQSAISLHKEGVALPVDHAIQEDQYRLHGASSSQGVLSIINRDDLVTFVAEHGNNEITNCVVIIDHEDARRR